MITLKRQEILGFQVVSCEVPQCIETLLAWMNNCMRGCFVACLNPHSEVISRKDSIFKNALLSTNILLPDGVGIIIASRLLGGSISKRITGSDLFLELSRRLNRDGGAKYFFLGSTESVLSSMIRKMKSQFPNIQVCGAYSPSFKENFSEEENKMMVGLVNRSCPDVLWVGMTAPKQEKWIADNLQQLNVPVTAAVGAVFDFYAGKIKRPNPSFQRIGLEWLPRLIQNPMRLWRRMGVSAPLFLWRVLLEKARKGK